MDIRDIPAVFGRLEVMVRDGAGKPLAKVPVVIWLDRPGTFGPTERNGRTGADGSFLMHDWAEGDHDIEVVGRATVNPSRLGSSDTVGFRLRMYRNPLLSDTTRVQLQVTVP
jgi:hypothetical protein